MTNAFIKKSSFGPTQLQRIIAPCHYSPLLSSKEPGIDFAFVNSDKTISFMICDQIVKTNASGDFFVIDRNGNPTKVKAHEAKKKFGKLFSFIQTACGFTNVFSVRFGETLSLLLYILGTDGKIRAVNKKGELVGSPSDSWENIVQIESDDKYLIGRQQNGTVLYLSDNVAENAEDYWDAEANAKTLFMAAKMLARGDFHLKIFHPEWNQIVSVQSTGGSFFALRDDGNVLTNHTTVYHEVTNWKNIKSISSCSRGIICLDNNDNVIAYSDSNDLSFLNEWKCVKSISAYGSKVVGITKSRTVLYHDFCSYDPRYSPLDLPPNGEVYFESGYVDVVCLDNGFLAMSEDGSIDFISYRHQSCIWNPTSQAKWERICCIN